MRQLSGKYWVNTQMFHEQIFKKILCTNVTAVWAKAGKKLNNQLRETPSVALLKFL